MKEHHPKRTKRSSWFRLPESIFLRNLDLREVTQRRVEREMAEVVLFEYELELGAWFDGLARDLKFGVPDYKRTLDPVEEYEQSRVRRKNAWDFSELLALEPIVPPQDKK